MRPALCSSFLIFALFIHATKSSDEKSKNLDGTFKNDIAKTIIAKVTNMTLNAFAKVEPQQKVQMLEKIRERVVNASKSMGPNGRKYVDIVMEGVEATAFDDSDLSRIRNAMSKKTSSNTQHVEGDDTENKLVRSIAKKIEALTKGAFYNAKTNEEKQEILKNIMKRVVKAANKHKIMVRSKNEGVKPYGELVVEGVELVLQQQFGNGTERRTSIDLVSNSTNSSEDELQLKGNEIDRSIMSMVKPEDLFEDNAENINTDNPLMFTSKVDPCGCTCIVNKTCTKISALSKFFCRRDKVIIELENMCDGVPDCPDKSDEENCPKNAVKSLRSASSVLNDIEEIIPRGCLRTALNESDLTSQHVVLKEVLKRQMDFLKKYDPVKKHLHISNDDEKRTVINQVNVVVSTVGFALESAFCVHENVFSRRSGEMKDEDLEDLLAYRSWAPPMCVCDDGACAHANCSISCERNCWQRFSLGQWACPAVNFEASVPLDFICDGKVDCYDETDERGCSTGNNSADKFEASDMYNFILKVLATKITLKEYHPVLNKLNALQKSIKTLQQYSIKMKPDVSTIRGLREKCFSELISIYDDILLRADLLEKVDEAYIFLGAVSEKLVGALKHSSTGNERIVVNDDCLCREEVCTLPLCSQTCVRACSVKSRITKYSCKDTNETITIDSICDAIEDCPAGDDEENCQKDICRNHHLVVLRNKLQNMKDFHKGIAVGETLRSWKTKTIADLLVAEKKGRITRRGVRKAVAQILQDLTMSYASLGGFRRSKDKIEQSVDRFMDLAQLVKDTLRTCTK